MKLRTVLISLLAVGAAGTALAVQANDAGKANHPKGGHFARLDANNDGFIDRSEARGRFAERFDALDTSKDGKVSRDELKAGWQARKGERKAERMAKADSDKDGKLSWTEVSAQAKTRFDRMDANKDGYLDTTEMDKRGKRHHGDQL